MKSNKIYAIVLMSKINLGRRSVRENYNYPGEPTREKDKALLTLVGLCLVAIPGIVHVFSTIILMLQERGG